MQCWGHVAAPNFFRNSKSRAFFIQNLGNSIAILLKVSHLLLRHVSTYKSGKVVYAIPPLPPFSHVLRKTWHPQLHEVHCLFILAWLVYFLIYKLKNTYLRKTRKVMTFKSLTGFKRWDAICSFRSKKCYSNAPISISEYRYIGLKINISVYRP